MLEGLKDVLGKDAYELLGIEFSIDEKSRLDEILKKKREKRDLKYNKIKIKGEVNMSQKAEVIKTIKEMGNVTQEELAKLVDVPHNSLYAILSILRKEGIIIQSGMNKDRGGKVFQYVENPVAVAVRPSIQPFSNRVMAITGNKYKTNDGKVILITNKGTFDIKTGLQVDLEKYSDNDLILVTSMKISCSVEFDL